MSEYWYAPPLREIVNRYYFQEQERLPQYLTEEVLRARMAELPERRGALRLGGADHRAGRAGRARHHRRRRAAASAMTLEADYVVGCDGGHSTRAPADRHRARRHRLRPAHGAGGVPLARAARRLQALPAALDLPGDASRPEGLLDVLRPRRRGRRLLLPCAGAAQHHARQLRLPRPAAARRRLRFRLRVRLCRLLGPAHRGRREVSGRPRVHRRRRRAQPSALWRLRPQQRPRRRRQSRLEARRAAEGLGQRCAAANPTRRSGGRCSRRRRRQFIEARIEAGPRPPGALQPGARPRRRSSAPGRRCRDDVAARAP